MRPLFVVTLLALAALAGYQYRGLDEQIENHELARYQEGVSEGLMIAWNGEYRDAGVPPKKVSACRQSKVDFRYNAKMMASR